MLQFTYRISLFIYWMHRSLTTVDAVLISHLRSDPRRINRILVKNLLFVSIVFLKHSIFYEHQINFCRFFLLFNVQCIQFQCCFRFGVTNFSYIFWASVSSSSSSSEPSLITALSCLSDYPHYSQKFPPDLKNEAWNISSYAPCIDDVMFLSLAKNFWKFMSITPLETFYYTLIYWLW